MATRRIFFLRHGETDWNAEGRLQGQKDIPLNETGRWQAGEAGRKLAKLLGPAGLADPDLRWIASPLSRAADSMRLARAAAGLPQDGFTFEARLKELTFGEWEGLTWPEVQARAPQAAKWRDGDKWRFQPPGGESYAMLAERVQPWIDELDSDVVAAAHGGVARVLMALLAALPVEQAAVAGIWQGRVIVFQDGRMRWV